VEKLSISNKITKTDYEIGINIIKQIFKLPSIISLCITSIIMGVYMTINYMKTSSNIDLILIIISIITFISMIFLIRYTIKTREQITTSLSEQIDKNLHFNFDSANISIKVGQSSEVTHYKVENIHGHYLFHNYYLLYLDNRMSKDFIIIQINEDNIDKINELIQLYQPQKKLQKIRRKYV